jgi:ribosomal protein L3 glutamine methyltransferase
MLAQAGEYLSEAGILVVEVGYSKPALEGILPEVPFFWIDFEFGGDGVFVLTASQLATYQADFERVLNA